MGQIRRFRPRTFTGTDLVAATRRSWGASGSFEATAEIVPTDSSPRMRVLGLSPKPQDLLRKGVIGLHSELAL